MQPTRRVYFATEKFKDTPAPTADNPHPRRQGVAGPFEVLVRGCYVRGPGR